MDFEAELRIAQSLSAKVGLVYNGRDVVVAGIDATSMAERGVVMDWFDAARTRWPEAIRVAEEALARAEQAEAQAAAMLEVFINLHDKIRNMAFKERHDVEVMLELEVALDTNDAGKALLERVRAVEAERDKLRQEVKWLRDREATIVKALGVCDAGEYVNDIVEAVERLRAVEAENRELREDLVFLQAEYGESNDPMTADAEALKVRCKVLAERDTLRQEVERLRAWVNDLQSGMYVNCVYCGHRYGPAENTPVSMADVLKQHVEQCPEHPMSKLRAELERLRAAEAERDALRQEAAATLADMCRKKDIEIDMLRQEVVRLREALTKIS